MDFETDLTRNTSPPAADSQTDTSATRSCHNCNRKKVRCDKKLPCSTCVRSAKSCSYPEVGPRIRRSKKTIMTDMASRLLSLEKLVDEATSGHKLHQHMKEAALGSLSAGHRRQTAEKSHSQNVRIRSEEDVYIQTGSSSQYFNEILLSRVVEKEETIKLALTTPAAELSLPLTPQLTALGILSCPSMSTLPHQYHPSKSVSLRLWNTYINKVEGCVVLKITHVPTDQIKIYSTINDPAKASYDDLAFCFSIYFISVVSLDNDEAAVVLDKTKAEYLSNLKTGIEQALAYVNILDHPNLTALRAMAIYLSALRAHNHKKGVWILNGLAIRIAESLGIHRDGQRLGLPPFEAEVRRRLWWHLLCRDGRAGEDYGLEDTKSLLGAQDVRPPLNINDADIYPEMEELPPARRGWTAMTFSLIIIDLARTTQKLTAIATKSSSLNEDARARIVSDARARIEEQVKGCNPVIPLERMTLNCSQFLLRKLDFITRQQWLLLRLPQSREECVTEETLVEALEIFEASLHNDDELLKPFAWMSRAYPQCHVTLYILWHLCVKPIGPNVKRAWEAIDPLTSAGKWEYLSSGAGSKAAVMVALKNKADTIRAKAEGSLPTFASSSGQSTGEMEANQFDFDIDNDDWQTWSTFIEGFQPTGQGSPGIFWQ